MFILIFSLLNISIQQIQQCQYILNQESCINSCEWQNESCQIKQSNNYCNLNKLTQEQCRQHPTCAFFDNKCEPFFGCQAYKNDGANCPRISINCISISDQLVCVQKPINCFQITEQKYCGYIEHQMGSKESCEWKDDKCQFAGCDKVNQQKEISSLICQKFHNVCKFDGIECKTKLLECSSYISNCNSIIPLIGRCQYNSIQQRCMNASCYNYMEDSYEKCQQHFGQNGTQCVYNDEYFEGLCLEFDYKKYVGKCLIEMQNKSSNNYLSISKCFAINILKYDQKITFFVKKNNTALQRSECNTSLTQYECNLMETVELKKCQWNNNNCVPINSCDDYVLSYNSEEDACARLNLGCKQISCSKNSNGCCVQIFGCHGYQHREECTNNSKNVTDLQHTCIWENDSCRSGKCEDFNKDSYQCNNLTECKYIGTSCRNRKYIACEGLDIYDCAQQNCFYVNQKCYDPSEITKQITELTIDGDTFCRHFSDKLMYSFETKNCRLKTLCQNYSYYCQSMKQFDNVQCVNVNSQCQPMTSCSQIQFQTKEKCYQASPVCNTNKKTCEYAQETCSAYANEESCNFQLDSSFCKWNQNSCQLLKCEDLTFDNCDSKYLCMDPQACRKNMCVPYQNNCITIKSRCRLYKSEEHCYKSISTFCFWDGNSCLSSSNCQGTSCQQIHNYCALEEDRDQKVSSFNNS
ncbi:unnamed protein product [Paramecium octaurelia]|uniref:Uncharacterized protein n=1 Tax=Paramecium octaurelia TaxID=43137 RepID=A0A8S1VZX0_PAROT|nr:unnamed protein product [Paramecium octaurelia]